MTLSPPLCSPPRRGRCKRGIFRFFCCGQPCWVERSDEFSLLQSQVEPPCERKSSSQQAYSDFSLNADRRNSGSAKGARRRRGLMVKDFGLYCNDALDRVGD